MPTFNIQVFKQITGSDREWSNTYRVSADDLATAASVVPNIASMERQLHLDNVVLLRGRVSDTDPATDFFTIVPIGLSGTAGSAGDGTWLPLFNTVRVDIEVVGGGRPSRKYYRPPILESQQQAGNLDAALISLFNTQVNGLIPVLVSAGAPLIDPDGQTWDNAVTQARVQMRQLHRKRRRTAP